MSFVRFSIACIFSAILFNIYQNQVDWWIYTPVILSTIILALLYSPTCKISRIISSITIVCGTIQTMFLSWIIYHFIKLSSTGGSLNEVSESKYTFPIALATLFNIYLRLTTSQSLRCFGLIRNLLLIVFGTIVFSCMIVSFCSYDETLLHCNYIKTF
uniref:Inner membrane protein n=1 Tax=Strongyloides stercoralis TaxID=6248 RepID=A0A0K0DVE9_STRER